jgi:hypothetical protein
MDGGAVLRDLSLHILDIVENSIRAGATEVKVGVIQDEARDSLEILVEDNGPGLCVSAEQALDPFFTTKSGKRIGLGLSLLKATAESAGGALELGTPGPGGLRVRARLGLSHIDRLPLGDIAATLAAVVCTNPELELSCTLRVGAEGVEIRSTDVARALPGRGALAAARSFGERVREGIKELGVVS